MRVNSLDTKLGAYAVVDSETNPFLAQKLKFDWKEALKQYETI